LVNPDPEIFRTYDIRGVVPGALSLETVTDIACAFGVLHPGSTRVAVGRDGRVTSPELADAACRGLSRAGRTAIDIGEVPTPVLYYATRCLGTGAGIMVTGSHNPREYNGLKLVAGGITLYGEAIQEIRRRMESGDLPHVEGSRIEDDVTERYLAHISADVRLSRPMRIGLDCGNGVAGPTALGLMEALGCEVTPLFCDVDGTFPHHHPNPGEPRNLEDLVETVRSRDLDLGIAFDGDGDRLGVVDDTGRIIWADRLMMLFARDILSRHRGAEIIFDVKSSRLLGDVIKASGGRPLMWKSGHSLIKAKLAETGAPLAGELSGHICFGDRWFGFDDALYAAARLLELLSRQDRPASAVFAGFPDAISTPELMIPLEAEGAARIFMAEFESRAEFYGCRVSRIDGLRVDCPRSWGLLRASNTTPSLVARFEADTPESLREIEDRFRQQIHAVRPGLALPF